MSLKNVFHFLMIILWVCCLLVLFNGWGINRDSFLKLQSGSMHHISSYSHYSRKALQLQASKFDFTPFLHHHHHHHHHHRHHHHRHRRHIPVELEPPDDQGALDPLYGIEKRLVPTGPNPLHH